MLLRVAFPFPHRSDAKKTEGHAAIEKRPAMLDFGVSGRVR